VILRNGSGTDYYQFEHLASFPEVMHGVFMRTPGFSEPPFDRLNVSLAVGDDPGRVERNRQLVKKCLQAPELVFARQVHGDRVLVMDGPPLPADASNPGPASEGDALVTDRPGRFLMVQVADCQSILMYDPRRRIVANVHAGWRGSIANIAGQTLAVMHRRFGCSAGDVRAGIGPSLGPCCAEFVHYREEIPRDFWQYRRGTVHFDFWAVSRDQLMAAGVPEDQIQVSGLCTKCNCDRFFSYRGEKTTGRFPAVIGLRDAEPSN
jgi:polyphenol oxidase